MVRTFFRWILATYQTLSFGQWLVALPIGAAGMSAVPIIGIISLWPFWLQVVASAITALVWLSVMTWLISKFNLVPSGGPNESGGMKVNRSQNVQQAQARGDITQFQITMNAAAQRDKAWSTLRSAVLSQMPNVSLLESCSMAKPEGLEAEYASWVRTVKELLMPDYPDLATRFDIAPIAKPSNFDYEEGRVTFGAQGLWPEIWKKLRMLEEIEQELR